MRQVGENIFKKRTSCDATLVWWNDHPSEGVALVAAHISMQKMSENSDLREVTICNQQFAPMGDDGHVFFERLVRLRRHNICAPFKKASTEGIVIKWVLVLIKTIQLGES